MRVLGIPLLENKNLGVNVLKFQSFKGSHFQSFKVSKFTNSKIFKFIIPRFQTDIPKCLNVWDTQFDHFQYVQLSNFQKHNISKMICFFLDYLECPGVPKDE